MVSTASVGGSTHLKGAAMETKFRALRLVALLYRIVAWIVFILGVLAAIGMVLIGALVGRQAMPAGIISSLPFAGTVTGLVGGLLTGIGLLIGVLVQFVVLYAASDVIQLGLAVEQNTREAAYYLRGESTVAQRSQAQWEAPATPAPNA